MQRVLILGAQRGDLLYHKRLQPNHEEDIDELQLAAFFTGLYHSRTQVDSSFLGSEKDGISICRKNDSLWYSKVICNDASNGPIVLALYFDLTVLCYGPCIEIAHVFSESAEGILYAANKNSFVIDAYKSAQTKVLEAFQNNLRSLLPDKVQIKSISTWKEVTINKETKAAPFPRQPSTNPTTTTNASANSSSSSSSGSCFVCCFRRRRVDTSYNEYTTVASTPPAGAEEESQRPGQLQIEVIDYLASLDCCVTHQDLITWRPRRQVIFTALHTCSADTTASTANDELNIIHSSVRSTTIFHKSRARMTKCNANDEATLFLLTTNGAIAVSGQEADFCEFIATQQIQTSTIKQFVFDIISLYRVYVSEHLGVFSIAQKQLLPVNKS